MSARNSRHRKSYEEVNHSDPQDLWEEIPFFAVPSNLIIDIGDGWSAKCISYPHYCYQSGWIVQCVINSKYQRTMLISCILNEPEIVAAYTDYVKQYYSLFADEHILELKELINKEKIIATSQHKKGDIVLYIDAPQAVIDGDGTLLLVIDTKPIKTFKCQSHMALTTKIKHLDSSLNEPQLIEHENFDRPGTLYPHNIKSLVSRAEVKQLGDTAAKFKAIALKKQHELQEIKERYKNRVKVSELNTKGVFKNLGKLLQKKLDIKKIGIVTASGFPLSKSQFKYEIKKHCMENMNLCNWIRLKYEEYHTLSLLQLSEITGVKAVKLELDNNNDNNNNNNNNDNDSNMDIDEISETGRVVTWEGTRLVFDHQNRIIFIKSNLVRVDRKNKTVIGSRKQILHQRYLKKKENEKKEKERKEKERKEKKEKQKKDIDNQ